MTDERYKILKRLCVQDRVPGTVGASRFEEDRFYFNLDNRACPLYVDWPDYPKEVVTLTKDAYEDTETSQDVPLHMLTTILHMVNLS